MYLQILKSYISGYVRVITEGYFIERLINSCLKSGIFIWNSKRKRATILETNVKIKDFKKFVKIAKQSKCRIKIKQKRGIPFIFNKYKKRKTFLIFLYIIIIGIFLLSNFIWNIEIEGNENISEEEIIGTLKKEGLKIGTLKNKIDTKEIVDKMRLDRDDLAWCGIELKGTNAIVKIVEAYRKPEIIEEDDYCNIIAKKDGIIVKINATNGTPIVKEGDVVKSGTVLIGGWLEGKHTGINYVHANGKIMAKVWYTQNEKVELEQEIASRTQNTENKFSVRINNFTINFYKTLSKFEKYDTIEEIKKLKIFSNFYLPIELVKTTNYELKDERIVLTKEQAKEKAVTNAKELLNEQIGNSKNILNTYINYNETENYVEAQVIYEILEEIGTKEKIVFWKEENIWKKEV